MLRKQRKMTVEELALKVGKNKATIYRYEKGEIEDLPYTVLIPIADALGVSPSIFFDSATNIDLSSYIERTAFKSGFIQWLEYVGTIDFTDDELQNLMDYAKFLVSKRK